MCQGEKMMKKYFAIILCVVAILALGTVIVSAEATQEAGYWVENAANIDEILAGEAGEREIAWEVPFLHIKPEIDGAIGKTEYMPFELYEDYLSWMAPVGDDVSGTTEEEFQEFYDSTQQDFFDAYWGWDGEYMYIAFEIKMVNGYTCNPDELGGDVYLYAVNCLQVGFADVTASGKDSSYRELGFGVHSGGVDKQGESVDDRKGESITFNWAGNYLPRAGEDFVGTYDEENQVLVYEIRVHLQSMLGLTDTLVENGDELNYAWILAVNGQAATTNETWQLAFCHGIGGQYSSKQNQYFARIAFTGKPDGLEIKPVEIPGMSQEDIDYKLMEIIDMSDEAVVNTFEGENAGIEYVTEGEESFMRITSLTNDDYSYVYSKKYPKNILGGQGDYVVVKYRTSSPECEDMGIIYRNVYNPEYDIDNAYTEYMGTDGEWHTVIFYMDTETSWLSHFVTNIGFVPFYFSDAAAQQTIDIAWIKFYQVDPIDIYLDQIYDEDADKGDGEVTEAPVDETEAPVDETEAPVDETQAPTDETKAPEKESETEAPKKKGGCGSALGSVAVLLSAMAAAIALKKKDE